MFSPVFFCEYIGEAPISVSSKSLLGKLVVKLFLILHEKKINKTNAKIRFL